MKKEKKKSFCLHKVQKYKGFCNQFFTPPPYSCCGKPHLTNLPTRVKFSSEDLQEKIHFLQWTNAMLQQYHMFQQMRANRTQPRNDAGLRFGPWERTWLEFPHDMAISSQGERQYILLVASALCWKWKIQRAAGTWTRCTGHWLLARVNVVHCEGEPGEPKGIYARSIVGRAWWWFEVEPGLGGWYSWPDCNRTIMELAPPYPPRPAQPSQVVVVVGTANVVVSTIQAQGFVETTSLQTGRVCRSFGAAVNDE